MGQQAGPSQFHLKAETGQINMNRQSIINKLKSAGSAHTSKSMNMPVDKSQIRNTYVAVLIAISLIILAYGLVIVFSAVQNNEDYSFTKQLIGVIIGIVLMIVF